MPMIYKYVSLFLAPSAICEVQGQGYECKCPPQYSGNAYVECRYVENDPKKMHRDFSQLYFCFQT